MQVAGRIYHEHFSKIIDELGLVDIDGDTRQRMRLDIEPEDGDELQVLVDGVPRTIYLVNADGREYALRRATLTGTATILVSSVPLKSRRLGELNLTYGYGRARSPAATLCSSSRREMRVAGRSRSACAPRESRSLRRRNLTQI